MEWGHSFLAKKEGELDLAFASEIERSEEFRSWVLKQTKFNNDATTAKLLHEEQGKDRLVWWKHWWCRVPELGEERETDIFLVFEIPDTNKTRFALHIENKKGNGRFLEGQPEGYEPRARFMMNEEKYLSYSDFETILIAPLSFKDKNEDQCEIFDTYISYEDIARFIPYFLD